MARAQTTESPTADRAVAAEMRNVDYHFNDHVQVHIRYLVGKLVPKAGQDLPIFDDKNSFELEIAAAEMAITAADLTRLFNDYVFAGPGSQLKDVRVAIENNQLKISGTLHKKIAIPFETRGQLQVTSDGRIRIHTTKLKAAHVPAKGLMDLFGVELADLVKSMEARGITLEGDDFLLTPDRLFPPPQIHGRVTGARLAGNQIVQVFGDPKQAPRGNVVPGNYMAYRGHRLRFGKLTMDNTDLVLIDADPRDPFDFYLDHYREQLVAGYTRITPSFGLRTYMVDFNKLRARPGRPSKAPARRVR